MNKVLCLLVVVAVISKAYADAPAAPAAGAAPGAELNKGADAIKRAAAIPAGDAEPLAKLGKTAIDDGEKAANGLFGGFNSAVDSITKH